MLPRPGSTWRDWTPETRDGWLHTDIARLPISCEVSYTRYEPKDREHLKKRDEQEQDHRMQTYSCKECGSHLMVSTVAMEEIVDPSIILERRHMRPDIPAYTRREGAQALWSLIAQVCKRGEQDSLVRQMLKLLDVPYHQLEGSLTILGDLEMVGKVLWDAYHERKQEDLNEYQNDTQFHLIRRFHAMLSPGGVPLFARIGPPQETYHFADLPYLLMVPCTTHFLFDQWAEVLVEARGSHEWIPHPDTAVRLRAFEQSLRDDYHFREVQGPKRFTWRGGASCYWSYSVNLFP